VEVDCSTLVHQKSDTDLFYILVIEPQRGQLRAPAEYQKRNGTICREPLDVCNAMSEYARDFGTPTVTDPEPEDLRWEAVKKAALPKIIVLRNDHQSIRRSLVPDRVVARGREADITDMS
jgi:hypothetical protein